MALLAAALRPLVALPSHRTLASALSLSAAQVERFPEHVEAEKRQELTHACCRQLAPAHRGVELRFGAKSFAQLLKQLEQETSDGSEEGRMTIEQTMARCQDCGLATRELLESGRVAIGAVDGNAAPLTIEQVHEVLLQIAREEGAGGVARKQQRALELLRRCQCVEVPTYSSSRLFFF